MFKMVDLLNVSDWQLNKIQFILDCIKLILTHKFYPKFPLISLDFSRDIIIITNKILILSFDLNKSILCMYVMQHTASFQNAAWNKSRGNRMFLSWWNKTTEFGFIVEGDGVKKIHFISVFLITWSGDDSPLFLVMLMV